MLYCIIFNELPFCGDNEFATYHQITSKELSCETRDDDQLTSLVVQSLLDKDPTERINVEALLTEIQKYIPTLTAKSIKPKQDKTKSIKGFFNRLWNKKRPGKNSSRPNKDQYERPTGGNIPSLNTNEELVYSDGESVDSSFEEPVLVTDPLEILSVNERIDPNDVLLKPDFSEDAHSSPELYPRQLSSPQKLSDRRDTLTSSASLEIITPIKKLIRINNTPEKKTSPINRSKSNKLSFTNRRIPASNDIINFKTLLSHQEQESSETIEDIKQYLNYADN